MILLYPLKPIYRYYTYNVLVHRRMVRLGDVEQKNLVLFVDSLRVNIYYVLDEQC